MSFGSKFSKYIYNEIIFKNKSTFNTDNIKENDFNFSKLKNNDLMENFNNLFLKLTKNSYITKNKFIRIIEDNIDKMKNYYDNNHILAIILGNNVTKSNFWISLYTMFRLHEKYNIFIKYAYTEVPEVLDIIKDADKKCNDYIFKEKYNNEIKNKKILLIFSDDISYSGTQLSMHLRGNCYDLTFNETKEKTIKRKIPKNVTYFLNIIGCTNTAIEKFKYILESEDNRSFEECVIIPKLIIPTLYEFLLNLSLNTNYGDNYEKYLFENDLFYLEKYNNKYYLGSIFKLHFNNINSTLTYLPFKYPNSTSTVQNICGLFLNDGYLLNYNILKSCNVNLDEIFNSYKLMINNNKEINYNPTHFFILNENIIDKCIKQEKTYISFSENKCTNENILMKEILSNPINYINIKLPECTEICENFSIYKDDITKMYSIDTKNILLAYKKSKVH